MNFRLLFNQDTGAAAGGGTTDAGATTTTTSTTATQAEGTTNAAASTATTTNTTTPTEQGKAAANWYDGFKSQELKDYAAVKGFKDPETALDSYKNLEKLRGVPLEKIIQKPDAPDSPEWKDVFQKLGMPAEAKDYKIEPVEGGMPAEVLEQVKGIFHEANLTAAQAEKVVAKWNEMNGSATQKVQAEAQAKLEQSMGELKTAWGNAYEQNLNVAKAGAQEFGASPEVVQAMESKIGTKATMEFFHKIGAKLGEGQFTQGEGKSLGFGKMSPEAARAQVAAYRADSAFMAKYMQKSEAEFKLFNAAMEDAYPGQRSV